MIAEEYSIEKSKSNRSFKEQVFDQSLSTALPSDEAGCREKIKF
jgi:hypothetical protein